MEELDIHQDIKQKLINFIKKHITKDLQQIVQMKKN